MYQPVAALRKVFVPISARGTGADLGKVLLAIPARRTGVAPVRCKSRYIINICYMMQISR